MLSSSSSILNWPLYSGSKMPLDSETNTRLCCLRVQHRQTTCSVTCESDLLVQVHISANKTNMAENPDHSKPDIFSDNAYISKRSIRKTFISTKRYVQAENEHKEKETSSSAGYPATAAGGNLSRKFAELSYVNKAEAVSWEIRSVSDVGLEAGSEQDLKASAKHTAEEDEMSRLPSIRLKREVGSDLAPGPGMQQQSTTMADTDAVTVAKDATKKSKAGQSGKPLFAFAAMKKRHGVEVDAENRPYKCTYCHWAFKKYSNLLSHVETHRGLKPHVCDLCGKAYSHQGTLQQHKRLHMGEKPYSCPFCDKSYTWSSDYRKHIRTHTGEKPYMCEECGKEFVRSSDLRKHERNMHANDKPFPCSKCGKTFNKPLSLMRHERTHLGERPFLCPKCGKAFAVASRMAEHSKIHSGIRPYACHICSKSFTKSSNLAEHLSIHTGLRPHMCSECGLAFAMPSRLLRHQRTHAGIRPYGCQNCGRSFSRQTALQRHLLQRQCHSRVFICSQCDASFSCDVQLAEHLLSHGALQESTV